MTKARTLALLVVAAHWIVAIWHLFLAAKVLPAPNDHVSWLAVILITLGHACVSILVSKLSDKVAGFVALIFAADDKKGLPSLAPVMLKFEVGMTDSELLGCRVGAVIEITWEQARN